MKKLIALLMGLVLVFSFNACGSTSPSNTSQAESSVGEQETSRPESGKTLVVYFSATGNTEEAANYIAAATNADNF